MVTIYTTSEFNQYSHTHVRLSRYKMTLHYVTLKLSWNRNVIPTDCVDSVTIGFKFRNGTFFWKTIFSERPLCINECSQCNTLLQLYVLHRTMFNDIKCPQDWTQQRQTVNSIRGIFKSSHRTFSELPFIYHVYSTSEFNKYWGLRQRYTCTVYSNIDKLS